MSFNGSTATQPRRPHALRPGGGEPTWFLNCLSRTLAGREHTAGRLGVVEQVVDRNGQPPPHVHHGEDESFYVLEGDVTITVGEDSFAAPAGSFVFCPRDVPHSFSVDSERARLLVILTPGGFERFFEEMGEPAAWNDLPAPAAPDVGRIVSGAAGFGCEILLPRGEGKGLRS